MRGFFVKPSIVWYTVFMKEDSLTLNEKKLLNKKGFFVKDFISFPYFILLITQLLGSFIAIWWLWMLLNKRGKLRFAIPVASYSLTHSTSLCFKFVVATGYYSKSFATRPHISEELQELGATPQQADGEYLDSIPRSKVKRKIQRDSMKFPERYEFSYSLRVIRYSFKNFHTNHYACYMTWTSRKESQ